MFGSYEFSFIFAPAFSKDVQPNKNGEVAQSVRAQDS